jgi:hypothetical protein
MKKQFPPLRVMPNMQCFAVCAPASASGSRKRPVTGKKCTVIAGFFRVYWQKTALRQL